MNHSYSPSLSSDIIKNFFAKVMIKKYGSDVRKLIKSPEFNGKNFEFFMESLIKPGTIEIFQKYFSVLNLYLKLNNIHTNLNITQNFIKIILSSYTICYYPDIMNINQENEVSKLMILNAKSLVLNLKVLNSGKLDHKFSFSQIKYVKKFFDKSKEFKNIFLEWKNLDMEAVICNLSKIYIDLEREFNDIDKEPNDDESMKLFKITEEHFEKEKENILKKVRKINSKNGIEIFNKYYIFLNQEIDLNIYQEKMSEAIERNIRKAYWDTIKNDMLKIPPDYSKIIELLGECSFLLKQCTPKRNDLMQEIDNFIEIDMLNHYIKNEVPVDELINRMILFILTKIEDYQSQNDKKSFDKFKSDFETLRKQTTTKLSEVLIYFFQGVMPRLHNILESKRAFEKNIINN